LNFQLESSVMTTHRFDSTWRVSVFSVLTMLLAICAAPASAQQVRVAQRDDAGESATDDPDDTGDLTVYPDADEESERVLSPEEQAAALERRGGEQGDNDPANRAVVLGMHVEESDSGRVKVVDVAAASPAFEGGVREGDEILSFDGFTAKSYREWIDGIRKLVTDTPDGSAVSVELMRGNKRITAEIRTPEAKADDMRQFGPLGQQITEQQTQGVAPPEGVNQPFGPGVISDNDVFIGGGLLGDDVAGTTDRAVAEIFRFMPQQAAPQQAVPLNPPNSPREQARAAGAAGQPTSPNAPPNAARAQQNLPQPNNPGTGGASRIGLAGFRDDVNGMIVMLDVGGLAPGSYPVGIEDAGLILGGQQPLRSARNPIPNEPEVQSQERTNRLNRPLDGRRTNSLELDNRPANNPRPRPQLRQAPSGGAGTRNQSRATQWIPRTVLAQVSTENSGSGAATPPTGQAQPNLTPPTGDVNPNLTPPTGEVNPNLTPPTGQVLPPGTPPTGDVLPGGTSPTGQPDQNAAGDEGLAGLDDVDIASGNTLSGSTMAAIGVLTVDQSGTGRMQQMVEGVRVRDVVGQAIVIYAPAAPATTTVPPNTNVSGTRGEAAATPTQQRRPGNVPGANQPLQQPGSVPGSASQQLAGSGPIAGSPTPVAAGIIRMMSDRRPNLNSPGATDSSQQPGQPAATQQPTGEQPAESATRPVQAPVQQQ
jgi:hypothetical protein